MASLGVQKPWKAEYAKSSRSSCKTCKTPIDKEVLRLGKMVQATQFDGFMPVNFIFHLLKHFPIFFLSFASLSNIQGFHCKDYAISFLIIDFLLFLVILILIFSTTFSFLSYFYFLLLLTVVLFSIFYNFGFWFFYILYYVFHFLHLGFFLFFM